MAKTARRIREPDDHLPADLPSLPGLRVQSIVIMKANLETPRFVLVALLAILVFALPALGDNGAGDAAHFLRDGLGARGRGMGSAYVSLADDFTAPFWNPAPSIQSPSTVVGGGLEQRNSGLFTFSTLGGWHASEAWAAGAVVLTSDLYNVYHVSGGLRFGPVAVGLAVKSYQFGIPGDSGSGLGLDLGVRCAIELDGLTLTVAAVSRDIGWTSIRWGSLETIDVDRTAWVNRVGVALAIPLSRGEWTIELDGEFSLRRPPRAGDADYWEQAAEANLSLGMAFRWSGLHVRAGVQRFDVLNPGARFRPTVGLGIAVGGFAIDLALVPSPLGSTYLGGFQVDL